MAWLTRPERDSRRRAADRSPRFTDLPRSAAAYVLVVWALAVGIVAFGLSDARARGGLGGWVLVLCLLARQVFVRINAEPRDDGRGLWRGDTVADTSIMSASTIFVAVLAGPVAAAAFAGVGMYLSQRSLSRAPHRAWFNVALHAVAASAAGWAYGALVAMVRSGGPAWGLHAAHSGGLAAGGGMLLAVLAHLLTTSFGVPAAVSLSTGTPLTAVIETDLLLTEAGTLCMGALAAGAAAVTPLLVVLVLVPMVVQQRAVFYQSLLLASRTEPKTGLCNAVYFQDAGTALVAAHIRDDKPCALLVCDLDYLRQVNNTHGHLAGDVVIAGIAAVLREATRATDLVARFGGEEFLVLSPDTDEEGGLRLAERIRAAVADREFAFEGGGSAHVSVSVGVAVLPDAGEDLTALTHAADVAVYRAKQNGRNRVELAGPDDRNEEIPRG